ncbi:uncharacterized protein NECHADRAFT_48802, partial [Fusarium vanettenii 77-13-4]
FVITNSFPGGRFSDGLGDLEISGDVTHHIGGCFKDDGSPDDGCAAMRANGGGAAPPTKAKRSLDTFAGMSTWLGFLRPSTKVLYTVQFYYAVINYGGGWNMCTVEAWLGNRYFYFNDHFVMGHSVGWNRVLTSVMADSTRANFGIWMDCWGSGYAELYVDSIFISNQVTPQNIDRFQLNFEDSPNNPSPSSTRRSSSSTSRSSSKSLSTPSTPGEFTWSPNPTPRVNGILEWSDLDCFNCQLCDEMPSLSSWLPELSTSNRGEYSTPTTPRGPSTLNQGELSTPGPTRDSTTLNNWENSTPTPSRRPTTTSEAPAESSTSTCRYTHGEQCEMDRWTNHGALLCGVGAVYNGNTWTENRNDYPHQDNYQQCAAICQTLENCRSAGYYSVGNHCLFTSAILTPGDMTYFDEEPWKQSVWSDNSCWICPDCIPEDVLNIPSELCSYTEGDVCTRVMTSEDIICNLPAYLSSMYSTGNELDDFYPLQRSSGECAAICRAMVGCKGSGYKDGHCLFFGFQLSTNPSDPIPLQTDSPSLFNGVWDDPLCFNCPGCYQVVD